jgi:hypothetical protein
MMRIEEFLDQDNWCKKNNIPEGVGCLGCPGENKSYCADMIRNYHGNGECEKLKFKIFRSKVYKVLKKDEDTLFDERIEVLYKGGKYGVYDSVKFIRAYYPLLFETEGV